MSDAAAAFLSPNADDEESATQFMYGACFFSYGDPQLELTGKSGRLANQPAENQNAKPE